MEEGDKISFRIGEVPRMTHKEQCFKETQVMRTEWIIFKCLDVSVNKPGDLIENLFYSASMTLVTS